MPATYQPADPTTTFYSPEPETTSASQVQTTDKPAPVTTTTTKGTTKGTTLPETTVAADTTAHTETTQRPVAVSTVTTSIPERSTDWITTTVRATPRDETTISEEVVADETTTRRRQSSLETTTVDHYDTSTEADQAVEEETTLGQEEVAVDTFEAEDVQENEIEDHTTTSAAPTKGAPLTEEPVEIETTRRTYFTTERPFRGPLRLKDRLKGYKKKKSKLRPRRPSPTVVSKSVYGAIKREEYIKNWVSRKKYNATATTPSSVEKIKFAPTVLPSKYFNVEVDHTITSSQKEPVVSTAVTSTVTSSKSVKDRKNYFLDKLNSARKTLKQLKGIESSASSSSQSSEKSSKKLWSYPRGSDTNVFRSWGGSSLSQAEFERKVLGVSTATEVSVKSMICVRGRCFNADDKNVQY